MAIPCIMRIFLAFAKEACALRRERGWTIDRVQGEAEEFLRRLTIRVVFDKFPGLDQYWTSNWDGSIAPDVERRFRASAEWKEYEELLLSTPDEAERLRTNANQTEPSKAAEKIGLYRSDPEVAKRVALVKANPGVPAAEMCEIFDRETVPLSAKWLDAGLQTWSRAYKNSDYRGRIDTLISKDRAR